MSDSSVLTRIAQTVGIGTSLLLGGANATLSIFLIPRLLESPTPLLLRQWNNMYEQGKSTIPRINIIVILSYLYLVYKEQTAPFPARWKVSAYSAAGILAIGFMPYTIGLMRTTNEKLKTKAEETRVLEKTDELGRGWARLRDGTRAAGSLGNIESW